MAYNPDRPLDPSWVDIVTPPTGRLTGCLPETEKIGESFPIFGDYVPEIPQREWDDVLQEYEGNPEHCHPYQYDQNGEGTCTSNATAQAFNATWNMQLGLEHAVTVSPISLYKFCGSGPNSGSSVGCNMKRIRDHGGLLIDNSENRATLEKLGLDPSHTLKAVGYYQKSRSAIESMLRETGKYFRIDEVWQIANMTQFFTAQFYGYRVVYGRSGHAIVATRPVKRSGKWYIKYHNSWGRWGDEGYGYDSLSYLSRTGAARGAYCYRAARIEPEIQTKLLDIPTTSI